MRHVLGKRDLAYMDSKLMIWYHYKKYKIKRDKKQAAAKKKKAAAAAKKKKSKGRLYGASSSAATKNYTVKEDKPVLTKTTSAPPKLERKASSKDAGATPKKKLSKRLSQTQIFDKTSPSKQPKEETPSNTSELISPAKTAGTGAISEFTIDPFEQKAHEIDVNQGSALEEKKDNENDIIDNDEIQKVAPVLEDGLNQIQEEENEDDEKEENTALGSN